MTVEPSWVPWLAGLSLSLVLGHFVTSAFHSALEQYVRLLKRDHTHRVPPALTGHTERLLFALIVALGVNGAAPAMIGWIAAKMAANWNTKEADDANATSPGASHNLLNRRFIALLSGAVSMIFAAIGGSVANKTIPLRGWLGWTAGALMGVALGYRTVVFGYRMYLRRKARNATVVATT